MADEMTKLEDTELQCYETMGELGLLAATCDGNLFDPAEMCCNEFGMVGATGAAFSSTAESIPLKHDEAMASKDKKHWDKGIVKEHNRMTVENQVFEGVPVSKVPKNKLIVSSTWNMKKMADGTHRPRAVARGFEQMAG